MRILSSCVFFAAFVVWAYLEFFGDASEGVKDILFWIGMLAMFGYVGGANAKKEG